MEVIRVPVPVPQAGEVLVAVRAAALNNTDLWTRQGAYEDPGDPGHCQDGAAPSTSPASRARTSRVSSLLSDRTLLQGYSGAGW